MSLKSSSRLDKPTGIPEAENEPEVLLEAEDKPTGILEAGNEPEVLLEAEDKPTGIPEAEKVPAVILGAENEPTGILEAEAEPVSSRGGEVGPHAEGRQSTFLKLYQSLARCEDDRECRPSDSLVRALNQEVEAHQQQTVQFCPTCGVNETTNFEVTPPRARCGAVQTRARGQREIGKYSKMMAAADIIDNENGSEAKTSNGSVRTRNKVKEGLACKEIQPPPKYETKSATNLMAGTIRPLPKGVGPPPACPYVFSEGVLWPAQPTLDTIAEEDETAGDLGPEGEVMITEGTGEPPAGQERPGMSQPERGKPGEERPGKSLPSTPSSPSQPNKAKRRFKREAAVQRALEAWDDEYIAREQAKCPEVGPIRSWMLDSIKPSWNDVRGESPATKAYYQQYNSLYIRGDVLYRRLESEENKREPTSQLIMPRALRTEFLRTTHEGVAGHLGNVKTRAHVGRRAYWFRWRRDVDIFCGRCDMCCEYKRGRR